MTSGQPGLIGAAPIAAAVGDVGVRDFSFSGVSAPTGQKPESKLWYTADGWFGLLWNSTRKQWRIYRFNWSTDTWTDTTSVVDTRAKAEGDALWDGANQRLYVSMHVKEGTSTQNMSAYLYRFSYGAGAYSLDSGFSGDPDERLDRRKPRQLEHGGDGTSGVRTIQIGNETAAQAFALVADDIVIP